MPVVWCQSVTDIIYCLKSVLGRFLPNGSGGKHLCSGCIASLSVGSLSPGWRCLLIKSRVLGFIVVLIRHRCGHPDSGKSSKQSWQQTPLRREEGVWNPGGTVIIVFDRDPIQICTCVKMNQAWAVNLWTEIFMTVVWREETGFIFQGWERDTLAIVWRYGSGERRTLDAPFSYQPPSMYPWAKHFTTYRSSCASLWPWEE